MVDTTWPGLIHVTDNVSVRNEAVLTIEPGTKIIVGLDLEIDFGWEGSHPTLLARGTPEAPILFCGETDTPGYWKTLSLQPSVNPDSVLKNVLIAEAGSGTDTAALILRVSALIQGVQVVDSGWDGVHVAGFREGSESLAIRNAARLAATALSHRATDWPDNSEISGNGYNWIRALFSDIPESVLFEAKGAAFQLQSSYDMPGDGAGLTIRMGAGTTFFLFGSQALDFGLATVLVEGTEDAKVRFQDDPACLSASCGKLVLGGGPTFVEHAVFAPAQATPDVTVRGPVTFKDVGFNEMYLTEDATFTPESEGLFSSFPSRLRVQTPGCGPINSLPADTALADGSVITVDCAFGAETVVFRDNGATFAMDLSAIPDGGTLSLAAGAAAEIGLLSVQDGGTLTIAAGATVSFPNSRSFRLLSVATGGTLLASGAAGAPVTFGGPSWEGIRVQAGGTAMLDYVAVDGAGISPSSGAVTFESPAILTNSTISNSVGWGLLHQTDDTTDYATSNSFTNNTSGDIGTL